MILWVSLIWHRSVPFYLNVSAPSVSRVPGQFQFFILQPAMSLVGDLNHDQNNPRNDASRHHQKHTYKTQSHDQKHTYKTVTWSETHHDQKHTYKTQSQDHKHTFKNTVTWSGRGSNILTTINSNSYTCMVLVSTH